MSKLKREVVQDVNPLTELTKATNIADIENKKEILRNKIDAFADKIVLAKQNHKPQAHIDMLTNFLSMVLQLNDSVEQITDFAYLLDTLGEFIGTLDAVLGFSNNIFSESLTKKYGFFQRIKARMEARKAVRNVVGRMKVLEYRITGTYKMTNAAMVSLEKAGYKIKRSIEKQNVKSLKRRAKEMDRHQNSETMFTYSPDVLAKLEEARKRNNISEEVAPVAPETSTDTGSETKDTGLDGII